MNGYEIACIIIAVGVSIFLLLKGFSEIIKAVEAQDWERVK